MGSHRSSVLPRKNTPTVVRSVFISSNTGELRNGVYDKYCLCRQEDNNLLNYKNSNSVTAVLFADLRSQRIPPGGLGVMALFS